MRQMYAQRLTELFTFFLTDGDALTTELCKRNLTVVMRKRWLKKERKFYLDMLLSILNIFKCFARRDKYQMTSPLVHRHHESVFTSSW